MFCAVLSTAQADDADPTGWAARLSIIEGAVSLQPAGVQEWTAATLNRPLTTGDRLWSDQGSRAELDLGTASVRLGTNTGIAFLNLDDHGVQLQLSAGTLIVSVRDLGNGDSYEVDTPNIALALPQPGAYRIEVNDDGTATTVAVSQGAAQASGGGQTVAIGAQQLVTFSGTDTLAWQSSTLGAPDEFDSWSAARERELAESASAGYVANDVPGTQDLDANGQWQQAPEYGYVWVPTAVAVGWVPYRYGHWVWITPWGWTWVDDAPWGYAPFHYGRWVVWNNHWCWVPAPRHGPGGRTVYAPALVAWVGGPGAVAFGTNIGWFPLGPRELYVPAYRVSQSYVRNVNITNTTVINNTSITNIYQSNITPQHYVNETPAAVTAVPRNTFTSGQRVGFRAVPVSPAVLAAAAVAAAAPAIAPTRQSVLGPGEGRVVTRPPAALLQRGVVVRTPPPPAPAPFERQLHAIQAQGGRPLTRSELAPLQPAAPLAPVRVVSRGVTVPARSAPQPAARSHGTPAPSLAERERALQQSALPPAAPRASVPPPRPAANPSVYAPPTIAPGASAPPLRSDRPPAAPQHPATTQRAIAPDDPTHVVDPPPAMPVYHLPSAEEAAARAPAAPHAEETYRAAPSPAVHASPPVPPPPAAHPPPPAPAPAHAQSNKEPRDSAPHGDRDSRERVLR
jgi:hypothetical protein